MWLHLLDVSFFLLPGPVSHPTPPGLQLQRPWQHYCSLCRDLTWAGPCLTSLHQQRQPWAGMVCLSESFMPVSVDQAQPRELSVCISHTTGHPRTLGEMGTLLFPMKVPSLQCLRASRQSTLVLCFPTVQLVLHFDHSVDQAKLDWEGPSSHIGSSTSSFCPEAKWEE